MASDLHKTQEGIFSVGVPLRFMLVEDLVTQGIGRDPVPLRTRELRELDRLAASDALQDDDVWKDVA